MARKRKKTERDEEREEAREHPCPMGGPRRMRRMVMLRGRRRGM